ncbi:MAG: ATP-binding cassette domain-containing protein [Rhodoferax sp.]|nr:ATP-binding cassette domain-containing protein [Rhodoferax sp.]MDP3651417.1 ATP-binding cassette domain-containing protein [Rhodoferax sp.]
MSPVFQLTDASVQLGHGKVQALCQVSLAIQPGERVALVGANGSGKSSLLRLLHGLLAPTTGRLQVDAAQRQAMLFQRPYLLRLSVLRNVALGLWLGGVPWAAAKVRAAQALAQAGLADLALRNARELSVGQVQRVALARALAAQPQVLLLDEPSASLDPHAKRAVEALLGHLAAQPDMTLVFASHNLGQVKRLASRVVYLEHGRVLADLPVAEFFAGPALQTQYPQAHAFLKGEWV